MPLKESTVATLRADIAAGPSPLFVIFSSKPGEDGKPWCGFCVKAEPGIEKVFSGEPYGLLVKYGPEDITDPSNWVFESWRLPGVPAIYRVENGHPAPLPTTYTDDFEADLRAYIASPAQWEEQLKKTEGDKYLPLEARIAEHNAQFDKIKVLIAEHRAKEAAKKAEEEAKAKTGGGKVCTGDVCLV